MINRSDYGPFRAAEGPLPLLQHGREPPLPHPADTPETLDYPKLEAISRLILGVVRQAADAESVPEWVRCPTTRWPRPSPSAT